MFENLSERLERSFKILKGEGKITEINVAETLKDVRRALLDADVNYKVAKTFTDSVKKKALGMNVLTAIKPGQLMVKLVHDELTELMGGQATELKLHQKPAVILMSGLNGAGKTTMSGKLALMLKNKMNRKPLLAACDTFRPAAMEQLRVLAEQVQVAIHIEEGAKDPIAVAKNAIQQAKAEGFDVVIVDTAGRQSIDEELMQQIQDIKAAVNPDETLLVVDAMTGQDAVNTAKEFNERLEIDGVILTKLDGDTRGGAALSIRSVVTKPIKFIGTGEKMEALDVFHPERMADRILGMGDVVSLVERAQEQFDLEEAKKLEKKIRKNQFDFNDFLNQIQQIKKMFVLHIANIIMVRLLSSLFFCLFTIICTASAEYIRLDMPNRDQLQTENILCIIQDSDGCIWYGTEGDGVYRDDGRHIDVFRNDAQNPSLIGSNNIASLAETEKSIIIGTFHGAFALDKQNFSIRCLTEVDDNRVDDILISRKGDVFITANKKIFIFDKKLKFKFSSPSKWHGQDVYIARLFETENNIIFATQWNGGLVRFDGKQFTEMPWNINTQPTNIAETGQEGVLWIGTIGQGIVRYQIDNGNITQQPETGNTICVDLKLSEDKQKLWMITMNNIQLFENRISLTKIDLPENLLINDSLKLNRLATDKQGRILAACDQQHSFAIAEESQKRWSDIALGNQDSTLAAITDSIARNIRTATHAEAIIYDGKDNVWFSTGRDVRCMSLKTHKETTVLDIADISALAIMPDNTLWLASIYGTLYCYRDGKTQKDDYGSNENGDGIVQLLKFDDDNLLLVHNRYERIYNTKRKTLRQQSIEEDGTYSIELLETKSGERWNRPNSDIVIEQLPGWMTSWWMICIYILLSISFILFIIQYYYLHRQRNIFLQNLKEAEKKQIQEHTDTTQEGNNERERWINKAIECVEQHLGEENYSVEQLSCDLCMSRMTLYRKIQGATGQKPTDFIRTIRLSHAARMLLKGEMTISEISDATGFSSVSHFSRSFRSMYGVSPREYRKQTLKK